MRTRASDPIGGAWSDQSVDLSGLMPDDCLLRLAMNGLAQAWRRDRVSLEQAMGRRLPRFVDAVGGLFCHGLQWADIMCRRYGFDQDTGDDLFPLAKDGQMGQDSPTGQDGPEH